MCRAMFKPMFTEMHKWLKYKRIHVNINVQTNIHTKKKLL